MNTIVLKSGMSLKTEDGEIINVRVYDDGWVKLEKYKHAQRFCGLIYSQKLCTKNAHESSVIYHLKFKINLLKLLICLIVSCDIAFRDSNVMMPCLVSYFLCRNA